jgi:hypothetical protein
VTITPDDKDWTWVLDRECPECGFDSHAVDRESISGAVEQSAARWIMLLTLDPAVVRARPSPLVWSPLEYACHIRDVQQVFADRLALMLDQDFPTFANWDQDETAISEQYATQEPDALSPQVRASGELLAGLLRQVNADADAGVWQRRGARSNGSMFTVESLARYCLHDLVHHWHDVSGEQRLAGAAR